MTLSCNVLNGGECGAGRCPGGALGESATVCPGMDGELYYSIKGVYEGSRRHLEGSSKGCILIIPSVNAGYVPYLCLLNAFWSFHSFF